LSWEVIEAARSSPRDDNFALYAYPLCMAGGEPHILLTLDTTEPVELGAFVGTFTALANEYERFIRATNPDLADRAEVFVTEIRPGSVVADLVPWFAIASPLIAEMDKILIVEQFVRQWGRRLLALAPKRLIRLPTTETRSELKDFADAVRAIATDPDASAKVEAATFEDGKKKVRAAFKFTTTEARRIQKAVERRQVELEKRVHADHPRVLMRFTRSDIGDVSVGKRSGERVVIDEISDRSLPLVYGSELAEQRIKHEIREGQDNVYKKGFVADVNVRLVGGRPAAYAVTNLHQVIDLPD
jgi:hypothetical protein